MNEEKCWFCHRTHEELLNAMPEGFWDDSNSYFSSYGVTGKIEGIRTNTDWTRADGLLTFRLLKVKQSEVYICRICEQIAFDIGLVLADRRSDEPAISPLWGIYDGKDAVKRVEHFMKQRALELRTELISEYGDIDPIFFYDKLKTYIRGINEDHIDIFLPDLTEESLEDIEINEKLIERIFLKYPAIGKYDPLSQVLRVNISAHKFSQIIEKMQDDWEKLYEEYEKLGGDEIESKLQETEQKHEIQLNYTSKDQGPLVTDQMRILKVLNRLNLQFPIHVSRLAELSELGAEKEELIEEFLIDLVKKFPNVGIYDEYEERKLVFNNIKTVKQILSNQLKELEKE